MKCLQAVETVFRQYNNAPKKALGYFLENLWNKGERASRELLVHMCSFSGSQSPLAAAECFKSAPKQLEHGELHCRSSCLLHRRLLREISNMLMFNEKIMYGERKRKGCMRD